MIYILTIDFVIVGASTKELLLWRVEKAPLLERLSRGSYQRYWIWYYIIVECEIASWEKWKWLALYELYLVWKAEEFVWLEVLQVNNQKSETVDTCF